MDEKKRQEVALKRFALISPVLNGFEQNAAAYFRSACEQPIDMPHYGMREYSPKTLRKWLNDYNRHGFDGHYRVCRTRRNDLYYDQERTCPHWLKELDIQMNIKEK